VKLLQINKKNKRMKRLFILLITIPLYSVLSGQNKSEDFHRVQLGVIFSPAYSYRTIKGEDRQCYYIEYRDDQEIAKFGFSGGLNVCFDLNNWLGIESGVLYANKGYRTEKEYRPIFTDPSQVQWREGYQWHRFVYSYHYIDVPLKVRFSTERQKIRFFAATGVSTGFLVDATITGQSNKGNNRIPMLNDYHNRINLSPMISAGIDYKVTSTSYLRIEPMYQYGLIDTSNSDVNTEHLWSVGVNVSYLIGIK
jgi:hypothetical protein